jgi:DNA repair protein RecO (recombination protein O)
MRLTLEPSYVLHSRPYRESSLLLEALSRAHGRVGLVARGARSARSRWKSVLQPFRPLLLSWIKKGELGTLT